jgi:hypothetical protein
MRILDFIRFWMWRLFKLSLLVTGFLVLGLFGLFLLISAYLQHPTPLEGVGSKALPWLPLDLRSLEPGEPRPIREFFPQDVEAVCGVGPYMFDRLVDDVGNDVEVASLRWPNFMGPKTVDLPEKLRGELKPEHSKAIARWLGKHYNWHNEGAVYLLVLTRDGQVTGIARSAVYVRHGTSALFFHNDDKPPCVRAEGELVLTGDSTLQLRVAPAK